LSDCRECDHMPCRFGFEDGMFICKAHGTRMAKGQPDLPGRCKSARRNQEVADR
jgi:hypothetical protein